MAAGPNCCVATAPGMLCGVSVLTYLRTLSPDTSCRGLARSSALHFGLLAHFSTRCLGGELGLRRGGLMIFEMERQLIELAARLAGQQRQRGGDVFGALPLTEAATDFLLDIE